MFRARSLPLLAVLLVAGAAAQTFEVASIKPVNMTPMQAMQSGRIGWHIDDALVDLQSESLLGLILFAFKVPDDQIMNAPDWLNNTLFDIHAKLPAGSTKDQVPAMLQSLLAERFKLTIHHQQEIRPVYELTTTSKLNLKPSDAPNPDDADKCKVESGHRACKAMTMPELALILSSLARNSIRMSRLSGMDNDYMLDRPVVDMTHLDGAFDFTLDYGRIAAGGRGGRGGDAPMAPLIRLRDSLDTLGFKLVPAKGLFDVIVIDHVEPIPTDN